MLADARLLDTASVITSAETASGTSGLVSDGLRSRVDALLGGFRRETGYTTEQLIATRRQVVKLLARRLSIARDVIQHPEILDEQIVNPVFVIGFPRTGTSLQQALLAADPANRGVTALHVHEPSPPPGERPVTAERRRLAEQMVQHYCDRCPGILALHPYWDQGADTLIEDEEILTLDFFDCYPVALCDAPTLPMRVASEDFSEAYAFLKVFMQHQQWKQPRKRWVMKGIEHQRHLSELFEVFPDARCLFPHREPAQFLPSTMAILAVLYDGLTSGAFDPPAMAQLYLDDFRQRIAAVLSEPMMHDPRVHHVTFDAFVADPIAALKRCYADWGSEWTAEGEAAMQAWLDDPTNDGNRYGRHRYTFEGFGIDWATTSPFFDVYRARFLEG